MKLKNILKLAMIPILAGSLNGKIQAQEIKKNFYEIEYKNKVIQIEKEEFYNKEGQLIKKISPEIIKKGFKINGEESEFFYDNEGKLILEKIKYFNKNKLFQKDSINYKYNEKDSLKEIINNSNLYDKKGYNWGKSIEIEKYNEEGKEKNYNLKIDNERNGIFDSETEIKTYYDSKGNLIKKEGRIQKKGENLKYFQCHPQKVDTLSKIETNQNKKC